MKNHERGQILVEFVLFGMVFATLWAVLIHRSGSGNVHTRMKDSIEKTQLSIRLNFPIVNLNQYGN